jgi:hypothetical protein
VKAASAASVEALLADLEPLDVTQLRSRWTALTNSPPPRVRAAMLRLALGYEIQSRAHGGLSRATQQRLAQIADAKTRTGAATPGMRLMREWNGVMHVVSISETGTIHWSNRDWRSLSEVARTITGTRWSGPAFFGLKRKLAA